MDLALVFPGQGAHSALMLEPFRAAPSFSRWYTRVGELLGRDPLDPASIDRNAVSSLLTVLASACALEMRVDGAPPVAVAGYSVGQLSALHAAGMIGAEDLFALVHARARIMDRHIAAAGPTGMMAVIGVKAPDVAAVCERVTEGGALLQLTNDNAPAQQTLGGTEAGLAEGEALLAAFKPKKLLRLPVAGAWHSRLLAGAVPELASLLAAAPFAPPRVPIADNLSGGWLPVEREAFITSMSHHVACPVRWRECVTTLIEKRPKRLVEVGFGDVLTKYGFFISRAVAHEATFRP